MKLSIYFSIETIFLIKSYYKLCS